MMDPCNSMKESQRGIFDIVKRAPEKISYSEKANKEKQI